MRLSVLLRALFSLVALAVCTAASPVLATEGAFQEMRSFQVGDQGRLLVRSDIGSFELLGGEVGVLRVEMARQGDDREVERLLRAVDFRFAHEGEEVRVEVRLKSGASLGNPFLARYRIIVPIRFAVDLESSSGNVSARNLAGRIRLETSGGNISLEEVRGEVRASSNGGGITARLSEQPRHDVRLTASGGNLNVFLAPDAAVDLDATARGGSVSAASRLRRGLRANDAATDLFGEINGGGPKMILRASGGNIALQELALPRLGGSPTGPTALASSESAFSAHSAPGTPPASPPPSPLQEAPQQPAVENLEGRDILPFIEAFNADKQKVRLVLLLSPG